MTQEELTALLRSNSDAPQTGRAALDLAQRLYVPQDVRLEANYRLPLPSGPQILEASDAPMVETCGEYSRGLVDLALEANVLSDDDRNAVTAAIDASTPNLEKQKHIGRFHFHWTEVSSEPDDNVTETQIDQTGAVLNDLYEKFSNDFRPPKADVVDGEPLIEIKTYFDGGLYGSTSSHRNEIFLNSRDVIRDDCRRQTTSAHELFHRVQYSYGYVTGTANQRWWVEALGAWSQQYAFPDQMDYIRRIVAGLRNPRKPLLERSYDACHFWKLLGERLVSGSQLYGDEHDAIRAFMEQHDSNGKLARQACEAILDNLHTVRPLERFFSDFATCNIAKDLTSCPQPYHDNQVSVVNCARSYGPYPPVLPSSDILIADDADSWSSPETLVGEFATVYYRARFATSVSTVIANFVANSDGGQAEFDVATILVFGDTFVDVRRGFLNSDHSESYDIAHEGIDSLIFAISGVSPGEGIFKLHLSGGAAS